MEFHNPYNFLFNGKRTFVTMIFAVSLFFDNLISTERASGKPAISRIILIN